MRPGPILFDFDDLSADILQDEDDDVTVELQPSYQVDHDFDALFPDDLTPTNIARAHAAAMVMARRPLRSMPLPALPWVPTPPAMPPPHEAFYAAPRPPPVSHRPRGSSSIAPVMLTAPPPPSPPIAPARVWPVFVGAALVGCAAVAVATVPLLLKGFAFHEATAIQVAQAAAPTPARKVDRPPSAASRAGKAAGDVVSIDDLPIAYPMPDLEPAAALTPPAPAPSKPQSLEPKPRHAERAAVKAAVAKRAPEAAVQSAPEPAKTASVSANVVEETKQVAQTGAMLHVVSTPPVNVVVDGRPLGMTPRSVRVEAGTHTVVFAGPEGRQVRQVDVSGSGDKTVTAAF